MTDSRATRKELPPPTKNLNDSRHDINVGPEGGILVVMSGLGIKPPARGASCHRNTGNSTPHHYCTHQRSKTSLTYLEASPPRTRGISLPP
ncbi:hypothetical protein AVEN_62262-1 [Araneus ventricosus]|uniref:Uncharacterized protein n=1 Tax=Araneus ventricosus TaxID=182803 RepID=A0A4Y2E8R5_ARAVE|nr:hypothetical protein AVEN_62262-1 [Araneus ventricosus]